MFTPEMLSLRRTAAGAVAGSGTYNGDGDPPQTPTHLIHFPQSDITADRIEIWDITTPSAPTKTVSWNCGENYARTNTSFAGDTSVCVKDGTAYFSAMLDGVYALDVSDPTTLGASQVLDNLPISSYGSNAARFVSAHPAKDVLWLGTFDGNVYTVDISNPASMSIISGSSSGYTAPNAYAISKDGEVCYVLDNAGVVRFELNASNQPSNSTSIDLKTYNWTGGSQEDLSWTENSSGDWFLIGGNNKDNVSVAEINSSYNVTSGYEITNSSALDRVLAICGMPYVTNYSTDDIGMVTWNRDDYSLSITTANTSTNTITHRVESTADITWISQNATDLEAFDQYVFIMNNGYFAVYEWSALNTFSRIATIPYGTGANEVGTGTNKMCLFKP